MARRQELADKEERRLRRQEEEIDKEYTMLEDHHHLHQQFYLHPESGQLFQIIDTITESTTTNQDPDKRTKTKNAKHLSVAWPVNADNNDYITSAEQRDPKNWDRRPVSGPGGTIELTKLFLSGKDPLWNQPLPRSSIQWLLQQQQDPELTDPLERCSSATIHLELTDKSNTKDGAAYVHRPMIYRRRDPAIQGPLIRTFSKTRHVQHGSVQHVTTQTFHQTVIPKQLRQAVMYAHHDQMGHPGRQRMIDTIQMKHWWPGMTIDIRLYAQTCRFCELRKANNIRPRVPIQAYRVPLHPFHIAHVDLTGPLSKSEEYEYIMIYKDALTKFTMIRKLPNKKARTIATALIDIFLEYGAPRVLVSDRGTEFLNYSLKNVCRILMTHRIYCTASNPRSNGLAENANRTIKDMLTFYCSKEQTNWATYVSTVQHIYNTTVNISTGYTPFYLLFGRECPSPDEDELTGGDVDLDEYARGLRDSLALAWDALGGTHWTDKTEVYNAVPKKRLPFKPYEIDQLVYLKRIPKRTYKNPIEEAEYHLSSKLQERFAGPFRIIAVLSQVLYKAMVHGKERVIHAINMKPARVKLDVVDDQLPSDETWQQVEQFEAIDETLLD